MPDVSPGKNAVEQTGCLICGYPLKGLPVEGNCPECGVQYDQSRAVFWGLARGDHEKIGNTRNWWAVSHKLISCTFILAALLLMANDYWPFIPWVGALVIWFAWLLIWQFNMPEPGPVQVVVSEYGIGQIDDWGIGAERRVISRLLPFVVILWLVVWRMFELTKNIKRPSDHFLTDLVIYGMVVLVFCSPRWVWKSIQRRNFVVKAGEPRRIGSTVIVPWYFITTMGYQKIGTDRFTLEIVGTCRWPRMDVVNAEVVATEKQMESLRLRAIQWHNAEVRGRNL